MFGTHTESEETKKKKSIQRKKLRIAYEEVLLAHVGRLEQPTNVLSIWEATPILHDLLDLEDCGDILHILADKGLIYRIVFRNRDTGRLHAFYACKNTESQSR